MWCWFDEVLEMVFLSDWDSMKSLGQMVNSYDEQLNRLPF